MVIEFRPSLLSDTYYQTVVDDGTSPLARYFQGYFLTYSHAAESAGGNPRLSPATVDGEIRNKRGLGAAGTWLEANGKCHPITPSPG